MTVTITPCTPCGKIRAISSKSAAHRALICAAFADSPCKIQCENVNDDIMASADCLIALGASVKYENNYFYVQPVRKLPDGAVLKCRESGSTLRFLLPVVAHLGIDASFVMRGRLSQRPLSPLYEQLASHGITLSPEGSNPLCISGKNTDDTYVLNGKVSSQFISGLLFAYAASGSGGKIIIESGLESKPYVDMTVKMLSEFGVSVKEDGNTYSISPDQRLCAPRELSVEGDWSGAAFPLCMGAISKGPVSVCGMDPLSSQGDKRIADILTLFGASVTRQDDCFQVSRSAALNAIEIDASQIPDLVPVIATVAAVAGGTTKIYGAARLRLKESDRLVSTSQMLNALGADVEIFDDGLIIHGVSSLRGGTVNTFADHRIAMSAAVAAAACRESVTILGAECVSKSYPSFWKDIVKYLGVTLIVTD